MIHRKSTYIVEDSRAIYGPNFLPQFEHNSIVRVCSKKGEWAGYYQVGPIFDLVGFIFGDCPIMWPVDFRVVNEVRKYCLGE